MSLRFFAVFAPLSERSERAVKKQPMNRQVRQEKRWVLAYAALRFFQIKMAPAQRDHLIRNLLASCQLILKFSTSFLME